MTYQEIASGPCTAKTQGVIVGAAAPVIAVSGQGYLKSWMALEPLGLVQQALFCFGFQLRRTVGEENRTVIPAAREAAFRVW